MKSLNEIAENIAFKLGDQFNHTLRESIKSTILDYRAKFIRDDLDRNFASDIHFVQTLVIKFEVVNLFQEFHADMSCLSAICDDATLQDKYQILRSTELIPIPVRHKLSHRMPYTYLGRVDGSKQFSYTSLDKVSYLRELAYQRKSIFYIIYNNRLYIINNLEECDINNSLDICMAMIRGVFEDPRQAYTSCDDKTIFPDDRPFPIGTDMLMQISNGILRGEYILKPKDGEQINIKPDDND